MQLNHILIEYVPKNNKSICLLQELGIEHLYQEYIDTFLIYSIV